jgi:alpha-L-rhamnosidase
VTPVGLPPVGLDPVGLRPVGLRCAHLENPLGVAADRVRFGWRLTGDGLQRAYQIQVTPNGGGWLSHVPPSWDSGQAESGESADVPYAGPPLTPGGRYEWRVRAWDSAGIASAWSDPASFEVELGPDGWAASWIGLGPAREDFTPPSQAGRPDPVLNALRPAPFLRRSFTVAGPVAAARLRITALGLYEARLNGHRVGDAHLAPGWTDYGQRVLYQSYDVTRLLREGENTLGAILGDGWYCGFVGFDAKRAGSHYGAAPELLAQLDITLADGTALRVVTDEQWAGRSGAIRHADLLMGERQDLRLSLDGWDGADTAGNADRADRADRADWAGADSTAGAGAGGWRPVLRRPLDGRVIAADPGVPVRVTQEIAPVTVSRGADGALLIDFGQNLTGWLRVRASGPAGTTIRVRHAEVLDGDGRLYTDNLRTARQTDEYVLAGGAAVLEPHFTLHGFRYAELAGYPGEPGPGDIVARVVHSDIPAAGEFTSSQEWLDRLFLNIDWGQRGNFISVPTDCPQRDERLGWLGDAQIFARTACYNRDVAAFFAKWLDDVAEAQLPSGAFPDIAPRLNFPGAGAPAWGDAGVIVPWTVWKMYGDRGLPARHLGAMTAWMDFIERGNPGYLRTRELGHSYNDWLAPGSDDTPPELLATAYWAHDAALLAELADAIGRKQEAARYRELRAKIGAAFAGAFVSGDGQLASGTQTAYVLGLHLDLIPGELRAAAAGHLVEAIAAADGHLSTGFVGVGYLLPALSSTGHSEVAYRLLGQRTFPSWRYMIDRGATTIWERWDGWSAEHGFQSAWMNSFNHYALGSVGEWLYRFVLGIDQQPGTAGFGQLLLRPHPGGSLERAGGCYQSVRGPVRAGWERSGGRLTYRVELPANVRASVHVPSADAAAVRDAAGGAPAAVGAFPGLLGAGEAVFHVGPGRHEFAGPAPKPVG